MQGIDLDFDDDLLADVEAFGMQKAQGDAKVTVAVHQPLLQIPAQQCSLEEVLRIAREVYGETNSKHSESFCQWVQSVLEGRVNVEETRALLLLLCEDKDSYGGRVGWKKFMQEDANKIERLRARRNAVICAMNVVHATLNQKKGRPYALWIHRALWRASEAEKDVKDIV